MSLLDLIRDPSDLRALPPDALEDVADEIRSELIRMGSENGSYSSRERIRSKIASAERNSPAQK